MFIFTHGWPWNINAQHGAACLLKSLSMNILRELCNGLGLLEVSMSSWKNPHSVVSTQKQDPGGPLSLLPQIGLVLTASEDAALTTELAFTFFLLWRWGDIPALYGIFTVVGVKWHLPLQYLAKYSFFPGDYNFERPQLGCLKVETFVTESENNSK